MLNPNSAIERVKNHLAYKLGQTVIEHRHNGGGYIALFKKLYKIKKQHKKEQKIYQQIIQVFPQLKYPSLETCSDYNEALRCKFHLSYMIGEVLIKAYQNWYKGGGFKLKNNIKKANKEFQIFREILKEFKELNGEALKAIQDNKQLFLKEFPRIKNILKTHQDYQPILDNIFHNFNYFIKNFDLIEEWLLSDDFKEKYKKENHPYPSLLDPDAYSVKKHKDIECTADGLISIKRLYKKYGFEKSMIDEYEKYRKYPIFHFPKEKNGINMSRASVFGDRIDSTLLDLKVYYENGKNAEKCRLQNAFNLEKTSAFLNSFADFSELVDWLGIRGSFVNENSEVFDLEKGDNSILTVYHSEIDWQWSDSYFEHVKSAINRFEQLSKLS